MIKNILVSVTMVLSLVVQNYGIAMTKTGDVIQGIPVISQLTVDDLEGGKAYRFMFQGVETATNQHWYVPVVVIKGIKPGKKLLLQAGVHGDELNGIRSIQTILADIDPQQLSGTVLAVIGSNRAGIESMRRYWPLLGDGLVDFNRVFPGKEQGNPAERQAWLISHKLYKDNVDVALDFHTQSSGNRFPLFIYADYRVAEIKTLAELFPANQIKQDDGEKGSVETTFVEAGIPAITVELGAPRIFDTDMIERGYEGIYNVMVHYGMIQGKLKRTADSMNVFIGDGAVNIRSLKGGFIDMLVTLDESVEAGQKLAVQRNAFGDVVHEYYAPVSGKILSIATDALREPGSSIMRILFKK